MWVSIHNANIIISKLNSHCVITYMSYLHQHASVERMLRVLFILSLFVNRMLHIEFIYMTGFFHRLGLISMLYCMEIEINKKPF